MKTFSGEYFGRGDFSVGILTEDSNAIPRQDYILYKDKLSWSDFGFAGYVFKSGRMPLLAKSGLRINDGYGLPAHFGDVVTIGNHGGLDVVWEHRSNQNALFLTDSCNTRCIMCPQPPKPHDKKHIKTANRVLDLIQSSNVKCMCITGGEPTLPRQDFLSILGRCTSEHPDASLNILTNGQTLSNFDFAKECALRSSRKTCYCISMHGDTSVTHDRITRTDGAFRNVHNSLYNLSRLGVGIEVRFVVSKQNYSRLPNLAETWFRTYPFVHHFAIMGLEMTGCATENKDEVWIDPVDYIEELEEFTVQAERRGLNFSLYNHQLCTLPIQAWRYAARSISTWKQSYSPLCQNCGLRNDCCGVFTTSNGLVSRGIHPINN